MLSSTMPLYRVILCQTYITKRNDVYAKHRRTRAIRRRISQRYVNHRQRFCSCSSATTNPGGRFDGLRFAAGAPLTFSEGVELSFSGVTLTGPQNKPVATGKLARSDGNKAQLTLPMTEPLAAGEYTVEWHVVSVDGHKTKGQYHFSVK